MIHQRERASARAAHLVDERGIVVELRLRQTVHEARAVTLERLAFDRSA